MKKRTKGGKANHTTTGHHSIRSILYVLTPVPQKVGRLRGFWLKKLVEKIFEKFLNVFWYLTAALVRAKIFTQPLGAYPILRRVPCSIIYNVEKNIE